jgi:regulator of sirC expression with transglutaminase-like and TPR domain
LTLQRVKLDDPASRAAQDYDQALRLDPKDVIAYGGRGLAYASLGQRERAIQDLRKSCELGAKPACEALAKVAK